MMDFDGIYEAMHIEIRALKFHNPGSWCEKSFVLPTFPAAKEILACFLLYYFMCCEVVLGKEDCLPMDPPILPGSMILEISTIELGLLG